jgi:hypothetical protein
MHRAPHSLDEALRLAAHSLETDLEDLHSNLVQRHTGVQRLEAQRIVCREEKIRRARVVQDVKRVDFDKRRRV